MKNKKDVYVIVDTPKKAKKLKKLLDMFGEKIYYEPNHEDDDHNGINMYWGYGFSDGGWQGVNTNFAGHCMKIFKEVSIKELRNILAVEHLKEGDVVVVKNKSSKWILKITGNNIYKFEHTLSLDLKDNYFSDNKWTITNGNFIRYATEAEKELLRVNSLKEQAKEVIKPVGNELELGKWYSLETVIIFVTKLGTDGEVYGYGLNTETNTWIEEDEDPWYDHQITRKATPKEVESALIEEAKRRYKVGDKLNKVREDRADDNRFFESHSFTLENNSLYFNSTNGSYYSYCIFDNGKWATPIVDKFAELKEAHKNGSVIQWRREIDGRCVWKDCHENDPPTWNDINEYRVKPEEKPKVGDLVKAWDNDERDFLIGKLNDIDDSTYPFTIASTWFINAKKITPQEAMELLTDYCR